jgi:hypothetical protein
MGVGYNIIKGPENPESYSGKLRPLEAFVQRRELAKQAHKFSTT